MTKELRKLLERIEARLTAIEAIVANPPVPKCGKEHYGWPCARPNGHSGYCDTRSPERDAAMKRMRDDMLQGRGVNNGR